MSNDDDGFDEDCAECGRPITAAYAATECTECGAQLHYHCATSCDGCGVDLCGTCGTHGTIGNGEMEVTYCGSCDHELDTE